MNKKQLEYDLVDLIRKYLPHLKAGEITESIIGFLTCACCATAKKNDELDTIEKDLIDIITDNVNKSKIYFEKLSNLSK